MILVVDDGSTDSTATIVEEAARADARIRLIHQANLGVAAARNTGLADARGEFVAPLDADDLWHPQNVALQVAALEKAGPDVGVSYGWFVTISEDGALYGTATQSQFGRKQEVLSAQLEGNFIGNSSSTVMRKAAVETVGGYDTTLRARNAQGCEDQALYISLARNWDFTFVPKYLIAYRVHPWSMSRDFERMARSQALVLADLHRLRPRVPGLRFGRGIARIYEGPLTTALLRRQWREAMETIKSSGSTSRWSLVHLLGLRMPFGSPGIVSAGCSEFPVAANRRKKPWTHFGFQNTGPQPRRNISPIIYLSPIPIAARSNVIACTSSRMGRYAQSFAAAAPARMAASRSGHAGSADFGLGGH